MNAKQQEPIDPLNRIPVNMKSGGEQFVSHYSNPKINLLKFWQWSNSDLLSNTARGVLAEFLVASSLDLTKDPRIEWESYDLTLKPDIKIEITSAAKYQVW